MRTYTAKQVLDRSNSALFEEITMLLSHSFTEDPGTKWLFLSHSRQSYIAVLPVCFRFLLKLSLLSDASVTVITKDELPPSSQPKPQSPSSLQQPEPQIRIPQTSTIRALSITIPPHGNSKFNSIISYIRAGILMLPLTAGLSFLLKFITEFAPELQKMTQEIFPDPKTKHNHWHLMFLAVHPDSQGQGLGRVLLGELQRVVREAGAGAEEGVKSPASLYLEASCARNKRLYERVGFVHKGTMRCGKWREDDDWTVDVTGKVVGGRLYGMTWLP